MQSSYTASDFKEKQHGNNTPSWNESDSILPVDGTPVVGLVLVGEAVVLCCVDDGEVLLTSVGVGLVDDVSAVEPESMDNNRSHA